MKLAMIVPGGVDRGGECRVVPVLLALLRRLSAVHEVHVFCLAQEPEPGEWVIEGAKVHNIGGRRGVGRFVRAVRAVLAENRCGRFDLIQSIWSGASGLVAVSAARSLGVPSVVHYAGGELENLKDIGYGGRRSWRGRMAEAIVLRIATEVTAASAPMVERLAREERNAQLIPLGVDLDRWPPLVPRRRAADELLRLIHVASLNHVKDQTTLLRALRLLMERGTAFQLDLIGEDTLDGRIQSLAAQLGLSNQVRFHGFLTQSRLRPFMELAHVNLISSRHETGPLVLLEAAVAGVPTVGTAVGHIAEWADEAALAAPIADAGALAERIERMARDEELRFALAVEAQRRAIACDADHTFALFTALHTALVRGESVAQAHGA